MDGHARAEDRPAVELRAVHKAFGEIEARRGIDLHVKAGELVAILRPNGAGKTTAISLILWLREVPPPASSGFSASRQPIGRLALRRGAILQEPGVPGVLTVRELFDES